MLYLIIGILLFPSLIGLFTLFHLFRSNKLPADKSNRINKIRLWWFVLTREDKFVGLFPWLQNDEWDNSQQITKKVSDE